MPGMFGSLIGPGAGSRLRGGDIRDEIEQGVLGPIHFPRVDSFPRVGSSPQSFPEIEGAPTTQPQPQRSGGRHVVGIIADALAGAAGQPGMYAQNNYARQREERRRKEIEALYARKRDDDWADFVRKAQFERENPKPQTPTELERYMEAAGIDPNSPEGRETFRTAVTNKVDPVVNIPLPGGDVYLGPRSGMGALGGDATPARTPTARAPESILQGGATTGLISPEDADTVRQSLGPNGQAAFDGWARQNGVRIGKRLSNGQNAYFINGKWYDNPEGR